MDKSLSGKYNQTSLDRSEESATEANSQVELFHKQPTTDNICYQNNIKKQ